MTAPICYSLQQLSDSIRKGREKDKNMKIDMKNCMEEWHLVVYGAVLGRERSLDQVTHLVGITRNERERMP